MFCFICSQTHPMLPPLVPSLWTSDDRTSWPFRWNDRTSPLALPCLPRPVATCSRRCDEVHAELPAPADRAESDLPVLRHQRSWPASSAGTEDGSRHAVPQTTHYSERPVSPVLSARLRGARGQALA